MTSTISFFVRISKSERPLEVNEELLSSCIGELHEQTTTN
jgi:hypothetical protein